MSGYLSVLYAQSFADIAAVRELPACGGWLLDRAIPGTTVRDAMGCYPLFCCERWNRLRDDIAQIGDDLVAISLVTDPFGEGRPEDLRDSFPDVCRPFKGHFVVDLSQNWEAAICRHHRRRARVALRTLVVELAAQPLDWLDEWCQLYAQLIGRHAVEGIARFSRECFARQLRVPGIKVFRARFGAETVGMLLWYVRENVAYYHLGAFNPAGYVLGASYALFRESLAYFASSRLRWAELGAGAGLEQQADDGLARFKRGWANDSRTAWFCGRILNHGQYHKLVEESGMAGSKYFPAYRRLDAVQNDAPQSGAETDRGVNMDAAARSTEDRSLIRIDGGTSVLKVGDQRSLPLAPRPLRTPR